MGTSKQVMLDTSKSIEKFNEFFASSKELRFKRRDLIIPPGIEPRYGYWIVSGIVNIFSYDRHFNTSVHARYREASLFPLTRILDSPIESIGVSAFTDVVLRRKEIKDCQRFISSHPEVMPLIVNQGSQCFDSIFMLNIDGAEPRLVKWLSIFAEQLGDKEKDYIIVNHPITIQEVADTVRLSRESTGKILAKLEELKLISFGRKNIIIWPAALNAYSKSLNEAAKPGANASSLSR
ncbi:MAG TPA: Crp/Fnr family transcriptional regulator [Candidatus Saccharimonadales bacterium]|nr:Crp/Fnr family transcriptional regulator [Candidatus Saccharimonadales bacterium]